MGLITRVVANARFETQRLKAPPTQGAARQAIDTFPPIIPIIFPQPTPSIAPDDQSKQLVVAVTAQRIAATACGRACKSANA